MMRATAVLLVGLSTTAAMGDAAPGRVPVPVAVPVSGPPGAGAWIAAVLVALATAVLLLPARRGLPRGWVTDASPGGAGARAPQSALSLLRSRWRSSLEPDLGLLLTEVASLLRAGATSQRAWTRSLQRAGLTEGTEPDDDGVPPALHALAEAAPAAAG